MPDPMNRRIRFAFVALLAGTLSGESAEICFKPRADVAGSMVLLGDVAEVRGADPATVRQLQQVELFPAPPPDRSRTLRASEVRQLLQLHGIASRTNQFTGSPSIIVAHRRQPASAGQWISDRRERAEDQERDPQVEVVCLRRMIRAGEQIQAEDLEMRKVEARLANRQVLRSTVEAVGQEAARGLAAGQPLDRASLRRPVLIARGQAVAVLARVAGVEARTTARALEDGTHGDLILLESLETRQRYSAFVTGWQQAEVLADGRAVADSVAATPRSFRP